MQVKTKIVSCHTAESKPVKQEVIGTVILPPLVFPAISLQTLVSVTKVKSLIPLSPGQSVKTGAWVRAGPTDIKHFMPVNYKYLK